MCPCPGYSSKELYYVVIVQSGGRGLEHGFVVSDLRPDSKFTVLGYFDDVTA